MGVTANHPQESLLTLFDLELLHVMPRLGGVRRRSGDDRLIDLGRFAPEFSVCLVDELNS